MLPAVLDRSSLLRPRRGVAMLVAAALLVPGCSTPDRGDGQDRIGEQVAAVALEDVALSVQAADPFDRVELVGLDTSSSPGSLAVGIDGLDGAVQPVRIDDGRAYVLAPLHPTDPVAGGDLVLRLMDGTTTGPALALAVGGLPPAPGAYGEAVEAMAAALESRASAVGFELDELRSVGFGDLPPEAVPVKAAQTWFDQEAGRDALEGDAKDLLDRVAGAIDLRALFEDGLAELPPVPGQPSGGTGARAFVGALADAPADGGCIRLGPSISNAADLSAAMIASAQSQITLDPTRPAARTLDAINTLLTGLGLVPVASGIAGAVASGLAVWQTLNEGLVGLYPTQFSAITAAVSPVGFPEDFAGAGSWSDVKVTASSTGWSADATLAAVVMNRVAGKVGSAERTLPPGLVDDLAAFVEGQVAGAINAELQAWLQRQPKRVFRFCAETWTVDVTDLPYSTAQVLDRRFTVDPARRTVVPREVGADVLRIAPVAATFGGRSITFDVPIETRPIVIDVTPDVIVVDDPGDLVDVAATIENAETPTLDWDPGQGRWEDGTGRETNGPRDRKLRTPTDPSLYPFEVVVESTSRTGLREDGVPPRLDTATVRLGRPEVTVLRTDRLTPLQGGDVVQLAGTERDGTAEVYPLVVDVQGYDEDELLSLSLRVSLHGQVLDVGLADLPEVSPGRRRLDREVTLYDFPDPEEEVLLVAELRQDDDPIATTTLDPLRLELERGGICAQFADVAGEMVAVFATRDTFDMAVDARMSNGGPVCQYLFQQAASFGVGPAPPDTPSFAAWRDGFYEGQERTMEAVGGLGDGAVVISSPFVPGKTVVFEVDGVFWAVGATYGGMDEGLVPPSVVADIARVVAEALRAG